MDDNEKRDFIWETSRNEDGERMNLFFRVNAYRKFIKRETSLKVIKCSLCAKTVMNAEIIDGLNVEIKCICPYCHNNVRIKVKE